MKPFVEPLPGWKGDTADIDSGSSNPEGSDTRQGPGHELPVPNDDTNANSDDGFVFPRVFAHANHDSVTPQRVNNNVLWNNQCAALMDIDNGGNHDR